MVLVRRLRKAVGGALVPLGGVSLYAAWVLTRRTVFDYVHLGVWGVLTGVVLVGLLLTVTFGGVVALSRGYRQFVAREGGGDDANADVVGRFITSPTSRLWKPLVAFGVVLWTVLFVAPGAAESLSAFEPLAVLAWVFVPVSVHLDGVSHGAREAKTRTRAYVVGSLFPFFAALFGAAYLVRTLFIH